MGNKIIKFYDIIPNIITYLDIIDIFSFKFVSKRCYTLVKIYKNKIKRNALFYNKIDYWCQIIMKKNIIKYNNYFNYIIKPDENLIIAIAYLESQGFNINHIKIKIIDLKYTTIKLLQFILGNIKFDFCLEDLLLEINKLDDNVIKCCILSLSKILYKQIYKNIDLMNYHQIYYYDSYDYLLMDPIVVANNIINSPFNEDINKICPNICKALVKNN